MPAAKRHCLRATNPELDAVSYCGNVRDTQSFSLTANRGPLGQTHVYARLVVFGIFTTVLNGGSLP